MAEGATGQSPVAIPAEAPAHRDDADWAYQRSLSRVSDDGYAIRVDVPPGSFMAVAGRPHILVQFHFHSPGEHTIGGQRGAMEMHLVHEAIGGALLVVGVPLWDGADAPSLEPLLDALPAVPGESVRSGLVSFDATDLLPDDRRYVAYQGSLTTPPYTEGVAWRVLVGGTPISPTQAARIRAVRDANCRPLQPLGKRTVG